MALHSLLTGWLDLFYLLNATAWQSTEETATTLLVDPGYLAEYLVQVCKMTDF
jgi:hypothetical protein